MILCNFGLSPGGGRLEEIGNRSVGRNGSLLAGGGGRAPSECQYDEKI